MVGLCVFFGCGLWQIQDAFAEVTEEANYEENIPLTEASLEPRQSERGVLVTS